MVYGRFSLFAGWARLVSWESLTASPSFLALLVLKPIETRHFSYLQAKLLNLIKLTLF